MKYRPEEVDRYLAEISPEKRALVEKLQSVIMSLHPQIQPRIAYQILMYRLPTGWVGLGPRKDGVTLYTEQAEAVAAFRARHPEIDTGKGCLRFRLTDQLPWPELEALIKFALEAKA